MNRDLKIGDWVNTYSKGIYRVERIIDRYYDESNSSIPDENKIGDKYKDRIIVSKRLLNSKFKKSISYDSCSEYYVSHLDAKQRVDLEKIINANPIFLTQLDAYEIPTITTVYNSNLQIDNKEDLEKVLTLVEFIKIGKTFLEIENEMKRLDILKLKPKFYGNYKFHFCNYNEECKDKRKIWRDAKLTLDE